MEPRQLRANYKTDNGQTENQTRGLLHTQSGDAGVRSRGGHGQTPPRRPHPLEEHWPEALGHRPRELPSTRQWWLLPPHGKQGVVIC